MEEPKVYQSNYIPEPGYSAPILGDQEKAYDLANLEDARRDAINRKGEGNSNTLAAAVLDHAIYDREEKWHKEDDLHGLTLAEKANMAILEGLTNKKGEPINTHAFIDKVDANGRKYRILHPVRVGSVDASRESFPDFVVFFCKDGAFGVTTRGIEQVGDKIADSVVWEELGNVIEAELKTHGGDLSKLDINLQVLSNAGTKAVINSSIDMFDFRDRGDVERLRAGIEMSEKFGVDELVRERAKVPDAKTVLSRLV